MGEKISFELRGEFIDIPSLGFFMQYHRSENGRFILAWQDACIANGKTITGNFILIDKDEIILEGETERPCNGKVSNEGTFIINDRISFEGRMGTFFVIRTDAKVLIEKKFNANLDHNGLSNDGNFAVCQICRSGKDSNKLFFFDLKKQELKWSCMPEFGNANSFRFDTENGVLFLNYNDGKSYRYNFDGSFLDSDKLEKENIEQEKERIERQLEIKKAKRENPDLANGYELFEFANEKRQNFENSNSDLGQYDEVISLLKKALEKGVSENTQASIHRGIGEMYLKQNKAAEAIHHFEMALSLNPKIGLKKVLQNLKNTKKTNGSF